MVEIEAKITGLQLKGDKDPESGELFSNMVFRGESQVNTDQVVGLFHGFQKKLSTIKFEPHDQYGSDFELKDVTIDTFNVKDKRIRIGHGKDSEWESIDYLFFTMIVKTDTEGECLKKMHGIFLKTVQIEIS